MRIGLSQKDVRSLARIALKYWNTNHGDKRIYVKGRRLHHYAVGEGLELVGSLFGYPSLITIGKELKRDDIKDKDEALLFLTREQEEARAQSKRQTSLKVKRVKKIKKLNPINFEPLKFDINKLSNFSPTASKI